MTYLVSYPDPTSQLKVREGGRFSRIRAGMQTRIPLRVSRPLMNLTSMNIAWI